MCLMEFFAEGLDTEVEQAVRAAIEELESSVARSKKSNCRGPDAAVAIT